ncbi:DNA alkylation repair protein [Halosquirtibacter xylanolyticus]|uniref:DNA alkylation repair protein n=1 Tax=Halosquirtibacter xylanolyticus TaxID=3374599 RepID=UPI0037492031|nr:DNA alkylation repair protein [Prolixibacteraceae bacterium]
MDFLLDNPEIEKIYQEIVKMIIPLKNGIVADSMSARGINYKVNLGASTLSLHDLSKKYQKNHLLALKLWNKGWRETMILAAMLEEPHLASPDQLDYWVKSFENIEISEQMALHLLVHIDNVYDKAKDWALGKKQIVKYTGILLMGRLALVDKEASDEDFESFFEVLPPLSKDASLQFVLKRTLIQVGKRNRNLNEITLMHLKHLLTIDNPVTQEMVKEVVDELTSPYIQDYLPD